MIQEGAIIPRGLFWVLASTRNTIVAEGEAKLPRPLFIRVSGMVGCEPGGNGSRLWLGLIGRQQPPTNNAARTAGINHRHRTRSGQQWVHHPRQVKNITRYRLVWRATNLCVLIAHIPILTLTGTSSCDRVFFLMIAGTTGRAPSDFLLLAEEVRSRRISEAERY